MGNGLATSVGLRTSTLRMMLLVNSEAENAQHGWGYILLKCAMDGHLACKLILTDSELYTYTDVSSCLRKLL